MQKDIDAMVAWAKNWEMTLNPDKCKVMHKGRKNSYFKYHLGRKGIQEVEKEKEKSGLPETGNRPCSENEQ